MEEVKPKIQAPEEEEVLNAPKDNEKDFGDIVNTAAIRNKAENFRLKLDKGLDLDPLYLGLLATLGHLPGAFFIFLVKVNEPILRMYAMQSIILNGVMMYTVFIFGIASIFTSKMLWLLIPSFIGLIIIYIFQAVCVFFTKGTKFVAIPIIGGYIQKQLSTDSTLPI
ncbi:hypothetical protein EIN_170490 [Entamoeba invadens IP1]|uniref:Uncharacterized protein n=1 Tax=Entamoeba invadens IP1 TaxID=370355 RepID=A0A0A1TVM5_ENTIV|nr:hypothetical protein EIN_170490 [Entamoeba invadens IP1]ELP84524.1 hypothetical protein EIN_170490 [Entamoeba invadens IP1]|eukprot:XP_004183870.1 hypothetical protein EIN_170490 [Entamoeba invadens IP1]